MPILLSLSLSKATAKLQTFLDMAKIIFGARELLVRKFYYDGMGCCGDWQCHKRGLGAGKKEGGFE